MTDKPIKPVPNGEQFTNMPGLPPDTLRALQTLLRLGSVQREILSCESQTEVRRFAQTEIATGEELHVLLSAIGRSADASSDPLALSLLHDPSVQEALVLHYIDRFEYVLLQHNQYLLFGERERAHLEHLYESFLHELQSILVANSGLSSSQFADAGTASEARKSFREVVVDLHVGLWQFAWDVLKRQLGASDKTLPSEIGSVGHLGLDAPPCHEYDPEFQLELWGLRPQELQEPILDLGCGEKALLVRFLRAEGLEAWGLDRFGGKSEYVRVGDWLDAPLEPNYWGTIISHMGFSNHFFHHHLRKDGHPERYARRFMEIVNALQPGGRFLYAPGLPFFEPLLPEHLVHIVTHPLDIDPSMLEATAHPDMVGDPLDVRQPALYATEVRRV